MCPAFLSDLWMLLSELFSNRRGFPAKGSLYVCFAPRFTDANKSVSLQHVVMVGGFSASNWLVNQVKEQLEPIGYSVYRSENYQ